MSCYPTRPFKEVCSLQKGKKPALQAERQSGSQPYLTARYMRGTEAPQWVPEVDKNAVKVQSHELIIICDGSNSGETFNGVEGILSSTMAKVTHGIDIDTTFLRYFLISKLEKYAETKTGAAIPHLDLKGLREEKIPVPPFSEQQRIVGILDHVFEGIDEAKANAERNLANAKELFANAFDELLNHRCQDALMAPLDAIANFKNGLNFTRSSKGEVIKIVGVADFKNNFWTPDELDEVQIEGSLSEAYELRDNDILVVRSNGNKELIGRCILARGVKGKTSHSGFTIRVRSHSDEVDAEYLAHFMKSSAVRKSLVASGDGTNISSLNQKALSSIVVPIPPVSVQRDIVNDLSMLGEKIGQMTAIMAHKYRAIDELHRSALHQAFSGNL